MPTDPFVTAIPADSPRQAQNLAPGVSLPPARPSVGDRPGEVAGPWPRGAGFGSPGPNIGFALTLVARARSRITLAPNEHEADAHALVAAVAMKRASLFGRAPVAADVSCALLVLGYEGPASGDFVEWRILAGVDAAHDYRSGRDLCAQISPEDIRLDPRDLAPRAESIHQHLRANPAAIPS